MFFCLHDNHLDNTAGQFKLSMALQLKLDELPTFTRIYVYILTMINKQVLFFTMFYSIQFNSLFHAIENIYSSVRVYTCVHLC